ncbi:hypothetical protein [Rhizobium sp. Leaf383]|uniref:hypothetical protein n=1 Tax=Rhizobium sp. Leaf383 TaxID=1736357 RepID=UPI0012E33F82|nr:hypothetical protein [Rhizobium sp. Leaf383]
MTDYDRDQLNEVLNLIHNIAASVGAEEETPDLVRHALSDIVSLSRYKRMVLSDVRLKEYGIESGDVGGGPEA